MLNKEIRYFFQDSSNMLNKGHFERETKDSRYITQTKIQRVLPPLEIIAQYEALYPGALEKALDTAQKAQEQKHQVAQQALKSKARAKIIGHVCGTLSFASMCLLAVKLVSVHLVKEALYIASIYIASITLSALIKIYWEGKKQANWSQNKKTQNANNAFFAKKRNQKNTM